MESRGERASQRTTDLVVRPVSPWSFGELVELWDYRELFWMLVVRDVTVRYKQAALGIGWAVLQPAAQVVVFTVLLHRLARIEGDASVPYPVFCLAGLVIWQLFSNGLAQASESLIGSANLITKVFFPRMIIPIASASAAVVEFAISFGLLIVLMVVYGLPLRPAMVLVLPVLVLTAITTISIALWTSAINVQYRDVRHALPFLMQLLVFVTPVFYPVSLIPANFRWLSALNPVAPLVEAFRALVFGTAVPYGRLALGGVITLAFGVSGYLYFRAVERGFADRV